MTIQSPTSTEPLLHVVMHEPEIPNNTGNIGRTCVTTGCALHLIHPLGFDIDDPARRRAGLDYWPRLNLHEHDDWAAYTATTRTTSPTARRWLLTTRTDRSFYDVQLQPGDHVVFGRESKGLPDAIINAEPESCVCLPMRASERSLNVSVTAGIVIYEAVRRAIATGHTTLDAQGRLPE